MNVIQNFQKFRVRVGCLTELAEALCRVIPGVKTPVTVCKYPKKHNKYWKEERFTAKNMHICILANRCINTLFNLILPVLFLLLFTSILFRRSPQQKYLEDRLSMVVNLVGAKKSGNGQAKHHISTSYVCVSKLVFNFRYLPSWRRIEQRVAFA